MGVWIKDLQGLCKNIRGRDICCYARDMRAERSGSPGECKYENTPGLHSRRNAKRKKRKCKTKKKKNAPYTTAIARRGRLSRSEHWPGFVPARNALTGAGRVCAARRNATSEKETYAHSGAHTDYQRLKRPSNTQTHARPRPRLGGRRGCRRGATRCFKGRRRETDT